MTHTYQQYVTACICGQPSGHHDHTGTWDDCPCSRCELDRESAAIFGPWPSLFAWQPIGAAPTRYEDVPATFKPVEALR